MARGSATTKEIDRGETKVRQAIAELSKTPGGPHVKVGILASSGAHKDEDGGTSGVSVVDVAVWNEFGTDKAPERPFMRTAAKELTPIMAELGGKALSMLILGKVTLDKALDLLGLKAQAVIKRTITNWETPPNAPATILKKARKTGREKIAAAGAKGKAAEAAALAAYNNPLQDTNQMLNSVQYEKVK